MTIFSPYTKYRPMKLLSEVVDLKRITKHRKKKQLRESIFRKSYFNSPKKMPESVEGMKEN